MTTTHALKFNGAPYTAEGELVHGADTSVTRGAGYAKCACGALSASSLTNGATRRAWFKAHKADALTAAAPIEDDIPLDPEPEAVPVAEAPAEDTTEDATESAFSTVLPFTKESPASFWRFLGRDAVRELARRGALGDVEVSTNATNHTLLITGATEALVETARERIETFWADALSSVKEWKKTDPEFLARPKEGLAGRKASYFMTGAYYMAYAEKYSFELI